MPLIAAGSLLWEYAFLAVRRRVWRSGDGAVKVLAHSIADDRGRPERKYCSVSCSTRPCSVEQCSRRRLRSRNHEHAGGNRDAGTPPGACRNTLPILWRREGVDCLTRLVEKIWWESQSEEGISGSREDGLYEQSTQCYVTAKGPIHE